MKIDKDCFKVRAAIENLIPWLDSNTKFEYANDIYKRFLGGAGHTTIKLKNNTCISIGYLTGSKGRLWNGVPVFSRIIASRDQLKIIEELIIKTEALVSALQEECQLTNPKEAYVSLIERGPELALT